MAFFRKRKRRFKRRRRRLARRMVRGRHRRRRFRTRIGRIRVRGVSGFPDSTYAKLRWNNASQPLTPGPTYQESWQFNNIVEPAVASITTKSFLGMEQWAALYERYEVRAAKIMIRVFAPDINPVKIAVVPTNDTTAPGSDVEEYITQSYATWAYINNDNSTFVRLKNFIGVKKLESRSMDSVSFIGNTTSNAGPSISKFFHFIAQSISGTDVSDLYIDCTLWAYVRFFRRRILPESNAPA